MVKLCYHYINASVRRTARYSGTDSVETVYNVFFLLSRIFKTQCVIFLHSCSNLMAKDSRVPLLSFTGSNAVSLFLFVFIFFFKPT
jgi:hypothetical protein